MTRALARARLLGPARCARLLPLPVCCLYCGDDAGMRASSQPLPQVYPVCVPRANGSSQRKAARGSPHAHTCAGPTDGVRCMAWQHERGGTAVLPEVSDAAAVQWHAGSASWQLLSPVFGVLLLQDSSGGQGQLPVEPLLAAAVARQLAGALCYCAASPLLGRRLPCFARSRICVANRVLARVRARGPAPFRCRRGVVCSCACACAFVCARPCAGRCTHVLCFGCVAGLLAFPAGAVYSRLAQLRQWVTTPETPDSRESSHHPAPISTVLADETRQPVQESSCPAWPQRCSTWTVR